jgi:hypothetical protein
MALVEDAPDSSRHFLFDIFCLCPAFSVRERHACRFCHGIDFWHGSGLFVSADFLSQRQIREKALIHHFPQSPEFKLKATGLVLLTAMVAALPGNRAYYFLGLLADKDTLFAGRRFIAGNRYLPRQWRLSASLLLEDPWFGWLMLYCIWIAIGRQ